MCLRCASMAASWRLRGAFVAPSWFGSPTRGEKRRGCTCGERASAWGSWRIPLCDPPGGSPREVPSGDPSRGTLGYPLGRSRRGDPVGISLVVTLGVPRGEPPGGSSRGFPRGGPWWGFPWDDSRGTSWWITAGIIGGSLVGSPRAPPQIAAVNLLSRARHGHLQA